MQVVTSVMVIIMLQHIYGHKFEQTLEDGKEQGSLACCSLWDHKESDMI